jgi:hypothetical protein
VDELVGWLFIVGVFVVIIWASLWWLLSAIVGVFLLLMGWAMVIAAQEKNRGRSTCPVCKSKIKSVIMTDARDASGKLTDLCSKHSARRHRIWQLENALNLDLSGTPSYEERKRDFHTQRRLLEESRPGSDRHARR